MQINYYQGMICLPQEIRKRDGRIVDFDATKIAKAIFKAFVATKSHNGERADEIAGQVVEILDKRITGIPGVEDVQDAVEEVLIKKVMPELPEHTFFTGKRERRLEKPKNSLV